MTNAFQFNSFGMWTGHFTVFEPIFNDESHLACFMVFTELTIAAGYL